MSYSITVNGAMSVDEAMDRITPQVKASISPATPGSILDKLADNECSQIRRVLDVISERAFDNGFALKFSIYGHISENAKQSYLSFSEITAVDPPVEIPEAQEPGP